ncbi:MAG: PhzF family phenazine biosynthesis protein [Acidobacteriia bacterium]|nr:PhzF family phenazine biosynthesis protein [Terriglobia bacterium]
MSHLITQVDAFTAKPFQGNPAAVCVLPEPRDKRWMQSVAREMNLSETAFLVRTAEGFNLRWFTPAVEVDLCGHATLASAHTLWEEGHLKSHETARFHTRSGLLTAAKNSPWIEMDFPATHEQASPAPSGLEEALGTTATYIGKNKFDYLVEVESEEVVRSVKPNFTALKKLPVRGVIVTSRSQSPEFDFISRFFAPAAGVDEDPVTGSAHCCLTPFWSHRLNKKEMMAYQASSRGGVVRVAMAGDRVKLAGQAITVMRAELLA